MCSQMEEVQRARYMGRRMELPCSLWVCHSLGARVFNYPEALWTQVFCRFTEASLCRHNSLTHWPLVMGLTFIPTPLPGAQSPNLLTLCFLSDQPSLKLSRDSQLPAISLAFKRHSYPSWYNDLKSCMTGNEDKDQICISYYESQYHSHIFWPSVSVSVRHIHINSIF